MYYAEKKNLGNTLDFTVFCKIYLNKNIKKKR